MSLWKIAWRSLQQRAMASWLTGLSMALGVALVALVLVIYGVVNRSFSEAAEGYNLIVGKKGSSLQLVVNTVFHLSKPIENIPWSYYKKFITSEGPDGKPVEGEFAKYVSVAVPCCLGDSVEGFRVVGTTPDLFEKISYGADDYAKARHYRCAEGEFFRSADFLGAVIGSVAAHKANLKLGDRFPITHGVPENLANADKHKEVMFKVVGILEPTGTPNDRAVFVNLEGFFKIPDHGGVVRTEEADAEHAHDADHEAHDHDAHPKHDDHDHTPAPGETSKTSPPPVALATGPDAHDAAHAQPAHNEAKPGDTDHDAHGHDVHGHDAADHDAADHDAAGHDADGHDADGHDADHDEPAGAEPHHHHHLSAPIDFTVPLPENQREVTAILLLLKSDIYAMSLAKTINKGTVAQAVFPRQEVATLMEGMVGMVRWILLVLAVLVVVVAGIGVMVSMYNSMSDRSREIAIMRSLGANRGTVMAVVLLESILLALLGGLFGVVLAHGTIGALGSLIVNQTGVTVGMFQFEPQELIIIPSLVVLAAIVGFMPALVAYRTDVAKALSAAP